jgi:Protein of unknown function (DUF4232)
MSSHRRFCPAAVGGASPAKKGRSRPMKQARRHPQLKWFSTLVATGATLLAAAAVLAHASVPAVAATQGCTTSGLDVWFNNEAGGGTAGSIYYEIEFTNLSGHACGVRGFPGVSATDLRGRKLGRAAGRDTAQRSGLVVLAAGATAAATLRIVDAGNFPSASCHRVRAAGLRVFPPGQTTSRLVPFPFQTCLRTGPAVLAVRALTKA